MAHVCSFFFPQGAVHLLYLRDHCPCSRCKHPVSGQRAADVRSLPLDCMAEEVLGGEDEGKLVVVWKGEDGHRSEFSWSSVVNAARGAVAARDAAAERPHVWNIAQEPAVGELLGEKMSYEEYMNEPLRALEQLHEYGLVFVKDVPIADGQVATLGENLGPLRHTFYGRTWNVLSLPDEGQVNLALTDVRLPMHQDLNYFESPPGIQILNSLEFSDVSTGGETIFIDGYDVVERLKAEQPDHYAVLKRVQVTFEYERDGQLRRFTRPTIAEGDNNRFMHLYYSPPWRGHMHMDLDDVEVFYAAYQALVQMVEDTPAVRVHLTPGTAVVFNNRRILHGRTAYAGSKVRRHLQGCYVDEEAWRSKWRVMRKAAKGADA